MLHTNRAWYSLKIHTQNFFVKLIKIDTPKLIEGNNSVQNLAQEIKAAKLRKVLVITDEVIVNLGLLDSFLKKMDDEKISYTIFKEVKPNPSIEVVEEARQIFIDEECNGIVAFGGGSVIDCAKAAGARVTNPEKSVRDMGGILKLSKKIPPLFAVPTTSGTGSEATLAAVITDKKTHEKFAINDPKLMPKVAVLDPCLTLKLPKNITSSTGMDALTHAVEAYIGSCSTKYTDENAEKATKMIFDNLLKAYSNGNNLSCRSEMAKASYYAGIAFTRAFIGYVHAIAHNLGGLYGVPHGLANAVVLPYVLEFYGTKIENKLAKLAVLCEIGNHNENNNVLSLRFIEKIKELNEKMEIPKGIKEIKESDIELLSERILKEANGKYPVPKLMSKEECLEILKKLMI